MTRGALENLQTGYLQSENSTWDLIFGISLVLARGSLTQLFLLKSLQSVKRVRPRGFGKILNLLVDAKHQSAAQSSQRRLVTNLYIRNFYHSFPFMKFDIDFIRKLIVSVMSCTLKEARVK